jgi:hypothetical protein
MIIFRTNVNKYMITLSKNFPLEGKGKGGMNGIGLLGPG